MPDQDSAARRIRRYVTILSVMNGPHWHGLVMPEEGDILHLATLAATLEDPNRANGLIDPLQIAVLERHARILRSRNDALARSVTAPAYEREKARLALRLAMDLEASLGELGAPAGPRPAEPPDWRDGLRSRAS